MFLSWWEKAKRRSGKKASRKPSFRPWLEGLEDRKVPAVLTVTTTADSGTGSLRQAILDADNTTTNPGQNTIHFNIATSGTQTINLSSQLPVLSNTSGIIIDGTTEPGFTTTPLIVLNGTNAGGGNGLVLLAGPNTVKGLDIENFSSGANGSSDAGILIESNTNTITGNILGANSAGTTAAANDFGIEITGSATGNIIGGTTSTTRNIISGNNTYGVLIAGPSATGNTVEGNYIGLTPGGTTALANGFDGVAIIDAGSNTIGGTATNAGNAISGNSRFGVYLQGTGTTSNTVAGNFIGIDATGTTAVANGQDGVAVFGVAANNTIGGTTTNAQNVISGNGRFGILLSDSGTTGNIVEGNFIGVNHAGTSAVANVSAGVEILNGAATNTIGGTGSGTANVIGGNGSYGILIGGSSTTGNLVEGNSIGTNAAGTLALANGLAGVFVVNGASNNTIGGAATADENTIAFNGYAGVIIGANATDTTAGNTVSGNDIYSNAGGIAVDLGFNGTSQNNLLGSSGPNHFQIFPVPSSAAITNTGVNVHFQLLSAVVSSTFRVEFFLNNAGDTPQGRFFLGSATINSDSSGNLLAVTGGTVTAGVGQITLTAPSGVTPAAGQTLTMDAILQTGTAPGVIGDTSEYSPPVTLTAFSISPATLPAWTVDHSGYSQTLTTTNGTGSSTFAVTSGTLPAGLNLSTGGVLSGTPTATGNSTFTVTATDSSNNTATRTYTLTINSNVIVTTASLPSWTQFHPYSQTLAAIGGTGNLTFSSTGALPTGLTLSSAGVLSGTPNTVATFTFTIIATDSTGATGSHAYTIIINAPVAISTSTLPAATINQPYSQNIIATGGTGTLTFTEVGHLPDGLSLSTAGVLSGTPTATGTFNFTVTATDTVGASAMQNYSVTVSTITITPATLPNWTVNQAGYSQSLSATGGTGVKTFAVTSGTLPTGLTLTTGGVLSGTPTTANTFTFTVTATDTTSVTGSQSYTVTINPGVTITTATLPNWTANLAYNQTINATGGTGSKTFSILSGAQPTGLTLSSAGVLSGTPTAAGTFTFTVGAIDSSGASTSQSYTVTINQALTITNITLGNWTLNQPNYSQTLTTSGGTGAVTFAITTASLPTGLTLNGTTGVISGTPTATGNFTFTVTARDSVGATNSQSYTITINPGVAITTATLPNWTSNLAYDQTFTATGGTGSKTFAVTNGTLPTGLTLSSSGVLSGTPTATTSTPFTFIITAMDTTGATASRSYTVTINPQVAITTTTLPNGTQGQSYSQMIDATGGTGALTFALASGSLPAGLTLNTSSGVISGTPTVNGTFNFAVSAMDTVGASAMQSYSLVIAAA